eukprot:849993-Alexandrium_andersonii.AAC.1
MKGRGEPAAPPPPPLSARRSRNATARSWGRLSRGRPAPRPARAPPALLRRLLGAIPRATRDGARRPTD